jgi:hypothetical protein
MSVSGALRGNVIDRPGGRWPPARPLTPRRVGPLIAGVSFHLRIFIRS